MRFILRLAFVGAVACTAAVEAQTRTDLRAVDATAADIDAVLKKVPQDAATDSTVRVVDAGGYHVGVFVVNRPKGAKNSAILHETRVTEVYHILKGSGTLVTGGTIAGPIVREPKGQSDLWMLNNVRGTSIKDGVSRRLGPGDVVVIPGYVPHWWSATDADLSYLVIRPDPDRVLPLKEK